MLSATPLEPGSPRPVRGPGGLVCACLQVTERQLLDTLSSAPIRSLRDLRRTLGAGDGCTACHDLLQQYLDAGVQRPRPPVRPDE